MSDNAMIKRYKTIYGFIAFGICLGSMWVFAASAARHRDPTPPVRFREHLIDHLPGAYQCAVADINGDGKPDIIALSSGRSEIAWYENPTWKKHLITTATHGNIDMAASDLDGDGKMEMAVASEFDLGNTHTGGRLQWYKPGTDVTAEWTGHDFAMLPTAHRLRWADWDGDGKKELVVVPILGPDATPPAYSAPLSIVSYAFANGAVTSKTVDRSLTVAHGMRILDFDGDGRDDLLIASYEGVTLFKPVGKGTGRTWQKIPLGAGEQAAPPKRGSSEVDRGWLKGRRPFLATIEPWHGNEVVVYTPPIGGKGLWRRQVIDATLDDGHALVCADLKGDGQSEILASYRGGGHNLYCYRCLNADGTQWERSVIDAGDMAGAGMVVADLNGDGRPDIVSCGTTTANVKWYENLGP
jgi:hypothetical protein